MDELEREDMRRDAEIDAQYKRYEATITITFTKRISARSSDEAESELFDEVRAALRGSHLDYDVDDSGAYEVDDERI